MPDTVLVVIDVQNVMFETEGHVPFEGERVIRTIEGLIADAREHGVPVHYIQHTTEGAGTPFERDTRNWLIRREIAPQEGDTVSLKTSYDGFWKTDLAGDPRKAGGREARVLRPSDRVLRGHHRAQRPWPTDSIPCLSATLTPPTTTAC